jgi:hypothetical protein
MSTRCVINFTEERAAQQQVVARIYRHSDGYPDGGGGVPADLERFFAAVESQTKDTRFRDPSYLAAKYIVWQGGEWVRAGGPLDFLSVGVLGTEPKDVPDDVEYIYTVDCSHLTPTGHPTVAWREA